MKKMMMIAAMMLMSIGAFAQDGKMAVGAYGDLYFGSGSTRFGLGAKFQYEFIENFRGELDFKYYPKKDFVTTWNANLNFHYIIPVADKFNVYPILGCGILGSKLEDHDSDTGFVFHGGAGAEYFVAESVKLNLDFIYQYGKKDGVKISDAPILAFGVAYVF